MEMVDDRTPEQVETHNLIVIGTDSFMSGWGGASGGSSYAGWACKPDDEYKVDAWVRRRGEMKRVRSVYGDYRPSSSNCAHCHIYVVEDGHPALS